MEQGWHVVRLPAEAPALVLPELEDGFLALMMLDATGGGRSMQSVVAILLPEHFGSTVNRIIWRAMVHVHESGVYPTVEMVAGRLRETGEWATVGGAAHLASLIPQGPALRDEVDAARWIVEKSHLRDLKQCVELIRARIVSEPIDDLPRFVAEAAEAIAGVSKTLNETADRKRVFSVRDLIKRVFEDAQTKKAVPRCTTGIADMDIQIGGLAAKRVTVFGGSTSWGKSAHANMVLRKNIADGKRVLLFTAEDDEELYGRRIVGALAKVSPSKLREGRADEFETNRVADLIHRATDAPVLVNAIGKTAEAVAAMIRSVVLEHSIDLVIVDYLQAIGCAKKQQDRRNELAYIARVITDAIKISGATGLLYSQIRRLAKGEVPTKHDLKEAGELENAAENVLIGYFDPSGRRCIRVDKCKDGSCGDYNLIWHSESQSLQGGSLMNESELKMTRARA